MVFPRCHGRRGRERASGRPRRMFRRGRGRPDHLELDVSRKCHSVQQHRPALLPIEGASFWYCVGARKGDAEARTAADMLSDEISKMSIDNSLAIIDLRWNTRISLEAGTIFAYQRARGYEITLFAGFVVIVPIFLATLILARKLRSAKESPRPPAAPRASSWRT